MRFYREGKLITIIPGQSATHRLTNSAEEEMTEAKFNSFQDALDAVRDLLEENDLLTFPLSQFLFFASIYPNELEPDRYPKLSITLGKARECIICSRGVDGIN